MAQRLTRGGDLSLCVIASPGSRVMPQHGWPSRSGSIRERYPCRAAR